VSGATPPEQVTAAAAAGYHGVGLRVSGGRPGDGISSIARTPELLRETERRLADTGLTVVDVEVIRITPQWRIDDEALTFEWAARVGAQNVLVLSFEPDEPRAVAAFVDVCARAREHGLRAVLEFAAFMSVTSLGQALRVLELADQPNAGILVDSLHLIRSGGAPADLASVPRSLLHYMQLCDARGAAPEAGMLVEEALYGRLLPGEGDLPLVSILRALPPGLAISVEAPNRALADAPASLRARRAAEATRRTLARI
jgi:sugar phosphate isomerase/epimerase